MKSIKKIEAGKSFSVKVPVEADEKTLDFLNKERDVSRNKFVYWILQKEANKESNKELSIPLSFSLTKEEKEMLLDPKISKSLEAFVKAIVGREDAASSATTTVVEEQKKVDFSDLSGMINYE